jgi:hypothetical protein
VVVVVVVVVEAEVAEVAEEGSGTIELRQFLALPSPMTLQRMSTWLAEELSMQHLFPLQKQK